MCYKIPRMLKYDEIHFLNATNMLIKFSNLKKNRKGPISTFFLHFLHTCVNLLQTASRVKPLNLKPMPEQPTYFTLRSATNTVLQKCPSKCIEAVISTPRMQYWTLTECNILVIF